MAYARRASHGGWYIYRAVNSARSSDAVTAGRDMALLFVQAPYRSGTSASGDEYFAYREIKAMLTSQDFSSVPGYLPADQEIVSQAFAAFVADVEGEGSAA